MGSSKKPRFRNQGESGICTSSSQKEKCGKKRTLNKCGSQKACRTLPLTHIAAFDRQDVLDGPEVIQGGGFSTGVSVPGSQYPQKANKQKKKKKKKWAYCSYCGDGFACGGGANRVFKINHRGKTVGWNQVTTRLSGPWCGMSLGVEYQCWG